MQSSAVSMYPTHTHLPSTATHFRRNISQYEYGIYYDSSKQTAARLVHLLIIMYNMFVPFNNINNVNCWQKRHLQVYFYYLLSGHKLNTKFHAIISSQIYIFGFVIIMKIRLLFIVFSAEKQLKARRSKHNFHVRRT